MVYAAHAEAKAKGHFCASLSTLAALATGRCSSQLATAGTRTQPDLLLSVNVKSEPSSAARWAGTSTFVLLDALPTLPSALATARQCCKSSLDTSVVQQCGRRVAWPAMTGSMAAACCCSSSIAMAAAAMHLQCALVGSVPGPSPCPCFDLL